MKEFKIIHTEIGDLKVPRKQLVDIKLGEDLGSNLMEGYNTDMGATGGFIHSKHNGYESQGREPFTIKEVEDFIALCCESPKMRERYSNLLILIIGEMVE